MRKKLSLLILCLLPLSWISAQSVWSPEHLKEVKNSLSQPAYATAYEKLLKRADQELTKEPLSVMMKEKTPASGDKHDYMSQARYFWPDPSKPNGLPYITIDGVSNPELEKLDRVRLGKMANSVKHLSLAWYFSGDERYAQKATELIRVWFFNKDTRMNPNLNYAQVAPGHDNDKGRCYGVIDAYSFVEMLDGVQLLESSKAFTAKDSKKLKEWFSQLLNWILTSEQGKEEFQRKNNHAVAYDAQAIAYALYTGNQKVAEDLIKTFPERRTFTHIEPDGKQPQELRRTLAFGYSQFNLHHMIDIFLMAQKIGLNIDNATSADGRNFYKAVDFLTPYLGKKLTDWPYKQISEWEYKQDELAKDIYRIYTFNPKRTDYLQLYRRYKTKNPEDLFNLLYLKADEIENAFAFADKQLNYALECAVKAKPRVKDPKAFSPRTVGEEGELRMVAPRDWCSGFFPGSLWKTFNYTNSHCRRQQAVSYTWPIEEMKWFKGTHDLGFIIHCSFGEAYRLTGEQSYKDVAIQAAKSLITRYSDEVKALRSWDFNTKVWQFPVIIDNMMNLELLFWATQQTGDSIYHNIAVNHANTTLKHHFRADHSSYHVVNYDTISGAVINKQTHQGIEDESIWSRGQAWGLYGYTLCYRFTKDPAYLKHAENIADFFYALPNMPSDLIPYWDMKDPAIPNAPRDASAASIIASALYELATYSGGKGSKYKELADRIVHNLHTSYQAEYGTYQGFLLLHSTGNYPKNDEIDVPISYADYYYLEALLRKAGVTNY
ncbi:MAG: alginate lyase family protein [Bacteroides sp.]|nr:alginate lyase family protein [Bacteroides sp.]